MAIVAKLTSIGILAVSFLLAIIFYYMVSSKIKEDKLKIIEEVISTLINFVIYIWVAKIILDITTFLRDPFAVLAYPSDSRAFYLACVFLFLHSLYRAKKDLQGVKIAVGSYVPIFLSASFFYEFIQTITGNNTFNSFYLALLFVLLILLVLGFGRWPEQIFHVSLLIAWGIGTLILAIRLPYMTIFGYLVSPLFISILLIMFIGLLIYNQRKVV